MMKNKFAFFIISISLTHSLFGQGTWIQKAPFPGGARTCAISFAIGNKGYYGMGNYFDDFWEYDPATNIWTQGANCPGGLRGYGTGFAVGNKGYAGTGGYTGYQSDFWEYDPSLNWWTQKANFGGGARGHDAGFSVLNKGYLGTGGYNSCLPDLWEFDPGSNTWTQKNNFIGIRSDIDKATFTIGNKAYWGTGADCTGNYLQDFWEYDPTTDSWAQKANYPGVGRIGATGFSICGIGYLGLGWNHVAGLNDIYSYDPIANSWSSVSNCPSNLYDVPAFVVNDKAYIVAGTNLYEYNPVLPQVNAIISATANGICVGDSITLTASGGFTYSWSNGSTSTSITVSPTTTTTYSVIAYGTCLSDMKDFQVLVSNIVHASFNYHFDPCKTFCVQFADQSSGVFSWLWDFGDNTTSAIQNPCHYFSTGSGNYPVTLIANPNTACADTFLRTVFYTAPDTITPLTIPNVFTPNDDGINDEVIIKGLKYCGVYEFQIFNRWGTLVFETQHPDGTYWDGRSETGIAESEGVYFYFLKGDGVSKSGFISLMR